jgi:hypothetical protein
LSAQFWIDVESVAAFSVVMKPTGDHPYMALDATLARWKRIQADWDEMQAELAELERGVRPAEPVKADNPARDPASTTTTSTERRWSPQANVPASPFGFAR